MAVKSKAPFSLRSFQESRRNNTLLTKLCNKMEENEDGHKYFLPSDTDSQYLESKWMHPPSIVKLYQFINIAYSKMRVLTFSVNTKKVFLDDKANALQHDIFFMANIRG